MFNPKSTLIIILAGLLIFSQKQVQSQQNDTTGISPKPKIVVLNLASENYQCIFDGPPETVLFHSGLITLQPDESVGIHNTKAYEEMIIVLEGECQLISTKGEDFQLKYGVVAYCPPHTEHNIKNTGSKPLKYIYIATKAN